MFNAPLTLVIKAPSSSVLAFTAFSPGERKGGGGGHYETQWSTLRGCLRQELRGAVCISRRSRNPTRHLQEFTRGEGQAAGVEVRDGVDSCALLKTANLENRRQRSECTDAFFKWKKKIFVFMHLGV